VHLDSSAVGVAIRRRREHLGISQEELAGRAAVHRTYVGSVERGERNITIVSLTKLAQAMGVAPSDILKDAEGLAIPSKPE
jgi:transcriptional regulator with XRE-family HTH domain